MSFQHLQRWFEDQGAIKSSARPSSHVSRIDYIDSDSASKAGDDYDDGYDHVDAFPKAQRKSAEPSGDAERKVHISHGGEIKHNPLFAPDEYIEGTDFSDPLQSSAGAGDAAAAPTIDHNGYVSPAFVNATVRCGHVSIDGRQCTRTTSLVFCPAHMCPSCGSNSKASTASACAVCLRSSADGAGDHEATRSVGDSEWVTVGARCIVSNLGSGAVRWIGVIGEQDRIGVELDKPKGLNTGSAPDGQVLFRCKPKHGVFVKPSVLQQEKASHNRSTSSLPKSSKSKKSTSTDADVVVMDHDVVTAVNAQFDNAGFAI